MEPDWKFSRTFQGQYRGKTEHSVVEKTRAYIAGFLDGDGCIMLQLVRRKDYVYGYQIRASIVFYQKIDHKKVLRWLKHKLRLGYLRDRNDKVSEYMIVGLKEVGRVLRLLHPYLLLKRKQAKLALEIIGVLLSEKKISAGKFLRLAKRVDRFGELNYSKRRINTSKEVRTFLKRQKLLSL